MSETEKEKQFREIYGELTDAELEAYGGMIFRQIKEKEDKINKDKKEDFDRQVDKDTK